MSMFGLPHHPEYGIFGVFDGHGGALTAEAWCAARAGARVLPRARCRGRRACRGFHRRRVRTERGCWLAARAAAGARSRRFSKTVTGVASWEPQRQPYRGGALSRPGVRQGIGARASADGCSSGV